MKLDKDTAADIINIHQAHTLRDASKLGRLGSYCHAQGTGGKWREIRARAGHPKTDKGAALAFIWKGNANSAAAAALGKNAGWYQPDVGGEQDDDIFCLANERVKRPTLHHFQSLQLFTLALSFPQVVGNKLFRIVQDYGYRGLFWVVRRPELLA